MERRHAKTPLPLLPVPWKPLCSAVVFPSLTTPKPTRTARLPLKRRDKGQHGFCRLTWANLSASNQHSSGSPRLNSVSRADWLGRFSCHWPHEALHSSSHGAASLPRCETTRATTKRHRASQLAVDPRKRRTGSTGLEHSTEDHKTGSGSQTRLRAPLLRRFCSLRTYPCPSYGDGGSQTLAIRSSRSPAASLHVDLTLVHLQLPSPALFTAIAVPCPPEEPPGIKRTVLPSTIP